MAKESFEGAVAVGIAERNPEQQAGEVLLWLRDVLDTSGMQQAELGRRLAATLNRPIERGTINRLVVGSRRLLADEMLAIARICRVPLPELAPAADDRPRRRA